LSPYSGGQVVFELYRTGKIQVTVAGKEFSVYPFLKVMGFSDEELFIGLRRPDFFKRTIQACGGPFSLNRSLLHMGKSISPKLKGAKAKQSAKDFIFARFFESGSRIDLAPQGRYILNKRLPLTSDLGVHIITPEDLICIVDELIEYYFLPIGREEPDHVGRRQVRGVGGQLQHQFRVGMKRLDRSVGGKLRTVRAQNWFAKRRRRKKSPLTLLEDSWVSLPFQSAVDEFFTFNPNCQLLDQINVLASVTHMRRISLLGLGGLKQEQVSRAMREVPHGIRNMLCYVESSDGPTAGAVTSLAVCARVNGLGFLECPYFRVKNGRVLWNSFPVYLDFFEVQNWRVTEAYGIDSHGFVSDCGGVSVRYKGIQQFVPPREVDLVSLLTGQMYSVGLNCVPFFEHNDGIRTLMSSNHQRQAVPLIMPSPPLVSTGFEARVASESGALLRSSVAGRVVEVTSAFIAIRKKGKGVFKHFLRRYEKSNQGGFFHQRPVVSVGLKVAKGQLLADCPSTQSGDLSIGANFLVGYLGWSGYNFEDGIVISERLVHDRMLTSRHMTSYVVEACRVGPGMSKDKMEEVSKEMLLKAGVSPKYLRHLNQEGLIKVGKWVRSGDILVGKVLKRDRRHEQDPPHIALLRAIENEKQKKEVKAKYGFRLLRGQLPYHDRSFRVPRGIKGRVVRVREVPPQSGKYSVKALRVFKISIITTSRVRLGDKLAGRHGNKGVVTRIVPREDMPYLPDGAVLDVLLNPLGVPSRMNLGQLFESVLGFAAFNLEVSFRVPLFSQFSREEPFRALTSNLLERAKRKKRWINPVDNKYIVRDGRSNRAFDRPIFVGVAYLLKLMHMVEKKIHARSIGPYSSISQQPSSGKARGGGQRVGEMEVWALEAHGAAYTLREMLTIKSDDLLSREETYKRIVYNEMVPEAGVADSFRVLLSEMRSLCLNVDSYECKLTEDGTKMSRVDFFSEEDVLVLEDNLSVLYE
jgi:DNA-directed RNA polymerase subunit beta